MQTFKTKKFLIRNGENLHSKSNYCTHKTRFYADDPVFSVWTVNLPFLVAAWGWCPTALGGSPSPPSAEVPGKAAWCCSTNLPWSGRENYFHHSSGSALIIRHVATYSRKHLDFIQSKLLTQS